MMTWIATNVVIPTANKLPNMSGALIAINTPLHIKIANKINTATHPINTSSYPKIENMYSVAKSELFRNKFVANFLTYHKAIPIEREKKDIKGTKQILKLLKEHNNIRFLIFPECGIYEDNYKYNKRIR